MKTHFPHSIYSCITLRKTCGENKNLLPDTTGTNKLRFNDHIWLLTSRRLGFIYSDSSEKKKSFYNIEPLDTSDN